MIEYIELALKGQVYLILIVFVMMIAGMVKEHGLFGDAFNFLAHNIKSKRAVVALVSAIMGLLPIKGRVTVSAGLLESLAPDDHSLANLASGRDSPGIQCHAVLHIILYVQFSVEIPPP